MVLILAAVPLTQSHAGHVKQITQYKFSAPSPELLTPALPTLPLSHTPNPVSHTRTPNKPAISEL